jgi:hypothetical protein
VLKFIKVFSSPENNLTENHLNEQMLQGIRQRKEGFVHSIKGTALCSVGQVLQIAQAQMGIGQVSVYFEQEGNLPPLFSTRKNKHCAKREKLCVGCRKGVFFC